MLALLLPLLALSALFSETSSANMALISESQADFGLNLLRALSHQGTESTVLSPASLAIALGMAYAGAKERTAKEMAQILAKGSPESSVHEYFGELGRLISAKKRDYTLEAANRLYVGSGFSLRDSFKELIKRHYAGQFEAVDFRQNEQAAEKINQFVSRTLHGKIKELVEPSDFDESTRMVLVNAIYFKGRWLHEFEPAQRWPFQVQAGVEKEVDMMSPGHPTEFIYQEAKEFQVLGMPYVGEELFMFVLLPREKFGLARVLARLDGKQLLTLLSNRKQQEVVVAMPKFKLEATHDLNEPLQKLGIRSAFNNANFSGISASEPLFISKVVQKTFIEVNEKGTEAAVATAILMAGGAAPPEVPPPEFIADHPFALFLVTARADVLFSGIFRG